MTIEAAQTINELNTSYPRATDLLREGDDHIRMVKATLQRTFPRITGTVNISSDKLNAFDSVSTIGSSGISLSARLTAPYITTTDVQSGTRTSGNSGIIRITTNTDREMNLTIPQDRLDTVVTNKTGNITTWDFTGLTLLNVKNLAGVSNEININSNAHINGNMEFTGNGNQLFFNNGYSSQGTRNTPIYHANNGAGNNSQRAELLLSDNGSNMTLHSVITNGGNQAYLSWNDKGRLDVNGPGGDAGVHTGGVLEVGRDASINGVLNTRSEIRAYSDIYTGYGQAQTVRLQRDGNIIQTGSAGSIFNSYSGNSLGETLSWIKNNCLFEIWRSTARQQWGDGRSPYVQEASGGCFVTGFNTVDSNDGRHNYVYFRQIYKQKLNGGIVGMGDN